MLSMNTHTPCKEHVTCHGVEPGPGELCQMQGRWEAAGTDPPAAQTFPVPQFPTAGKSLVLPCNWTPIPCPCHIPGASLWCEGGRNAPNTQEGLGQLSLGEAPSTPPGPEQGVCVGGRWKARGGCGLRTWEDEGEEFGGCTQEEMGDDSWGCSIQKVGRAGGVQVRERRMRRRKSRGGGGVEGCTGDGGKGGLGGMRGQGARGGLPGGVSPGPGPQSRFVTAWQQHQRRGSPKPGPTMAIFPFPLDLPPTRSLPSPSRAPPRAPRSRFGGTDLRRASPGPASGSRRHGYGETSAVPGPPPHRTRGCGAREPPLPDTDVAPRVASGTRVGFTSPYPHSRHPHPLPPTRVPSKPSPDAFLRPHNRPFHPGFGLSFWQQVPAPPHLDASRSRPHPCVPSPHPELAVLYPHPIPVSALPLHPSHVSAAGSGFPRCGFHVWIWGGPRRKLGEAPCVSPPPSIQKFRFMAFPPSEFPLPESLAELVPPDPTSPVELSPFPAEGKARSPEPQNRIPEPQNRIPSHHFLSPLQPPSLPDLRLAQPQPRHWRGASLCTSWGALSAPPKAPSLQQTHCRGWRAEPSAPAAPTGLGAFCRDL